MSQGHSTLHNVARQDTPSHIAAIVKNATTFPHFTELPRELRWKIWGMASEDIRLVAFIPIWDAISETCHIQVQARPVRALKVCQESRYVAFGQYTLIMFKNGNRVYVDFTRDIIFFEFPDLTNATLGPVFSFFCDELRMVQFLTIEVNYLPGPKFLDLLGRFNKLQLLVFAEPTESVQRPLEECSPSERIVLNYHHTVLPRPYLRRYLDHVQANINRYPHFRQVSISMVAYDIIQDAHILHSTCALTDRVGLVDSFFCD